MHTSLHHDFKNYVENCHSRELYLQLLDQAGLEEAHFESAKYHCDTEFNQMVTFAGDALSQSRTDFLCDMGTYSAGPLLEKISVFMAPDWNVLDLIENTETHMHKYVREELGAFPPALKSERISETEIKVDVLSHRQMEGFAKGFIQGFANGLGDTVTIDIDASDTGYCFYVTKTD